MRCYDEITKTMVVFVKNSYDEDSFSDALFISQTLIRFITH